MWLLMPSQLPTLTMPSMLDPLLKNQDEWENAMYSAVSLGNTPKTDAAAATLLFDRNNTAWDGASRAEAKYEQMETMKKRL